MDTQSIQNSVSSMVPANFMDILTNVGLALVIIIVGWMIAKFVAYIIGKLIGSLHFVETSLAKVGVNVNMEKVGKFAKSFSYFVVMLYVFVAAFERLNVPAIADPLNNFAAMMPQLLGIAALIAFAWIVASIAKFFTTKFLTDQGVDAKVGDGTASSIGNAVYGLVILFFLPAILGSLGLTEIVEPVQNMLNQIIGYVPNIFAAGIIFVVGAFIAKLVKQIVMSLVSASKADSVMEKMGLGDIHLANFAGAITYAFIIIPVAISALDRLQISAISDPARNMLNQIMEALPSIIAALVLITITFVIARFASKALVDVLKNSGLDNMPKKLGLEMKGKFSISEFVGKFIFLIFMMFGIVEAANMIGFSQVSDIFAQFIQFGTSVFAGTVTIIIGLFIAKFASETIKSTSGSNITANITKTIITVLFAAMGLQQMGLADSIVNMAFGFGVGAMALAFALSVGLGAKEPMGKLVASWIEKMQK